MATDTGLSPPFIWLVARTASHRYKRYEIPKKNGGNREIFHPARILKLLQRWTVRHIFAHFPVHQAATGYRKGIGIGQNASIHLQQNYVLKIDFRDFFPSITGEDVVSLLKRNSDRCNGLLSTGEDIEVVRQLVCRANRLTIGAPSSPAISNAVMFEFDKEWFDRCQRGKIHYSRYVDDLYFSTSEPNVLADVLSALREDVKVRPAPHLIINEEKTAFTSRKRRRAVTGLILTPDWKVSLGRKRKRYIRSLIFSYTKGQLPEKRITYLRGFLAYAKSIEPAYISALRRKYGDAVMDSI